jgi:hypothetical protein
VVQLYPRAAGTHFSRLLRHAQSITSHPVNSKSVLILSCHIDLPRSLFSSGLPTEISHVLIFLLICYAYHMSRPSHPPRVDRPNFIWWSVHIMKLFVTYFFHSPVTSSPLGPNFFIGTLFSNTLNLCFSLRARNQVSHHNNKRRRNYW